MEGRPKVGCPVGVVKPFGAIDVLVFLRHHAHWWHGGLRRVGRRGALPRYRSVRRDTSLHACRLHEGMGRRVAEPTLAGLHVRRTPQRLRQGVVRVGLIQRKARLGVAIAHVGKEGGKLVRAYDKAPFAIVRQLDATNARRGASAIVKLRGAQRWQRSPKEGAHHV